MRAVSLLLFMILLGCGGNQPAPNPELYEDNDTTQDEENNNGGKKTKVNDNEVIAQSQDISPDEQTRLAIQAEIDECAQLPNPLHPNWQGFYYDLSSFSCTTRPLFLTLDDCTLDNLTQPTPESAFADLFAPNQKTQLRQVFEQDYPGFKVTFCIDDGPDSYTVVGVKNAVDALRYEIVERRVPK
ncbi:MAG: hypothetical protein AB7T49_14975 [Oligoflexales bacterium]